MTCKICGGVELKVVYEGPIRTGKFGEVSSEPHRLYQCNSCHIIFLPAVVEDFAAYYEGQGYRREVDGSAEVSDYFRMHDSEQLRHLAVTGTSAFRNKVVADVGCGAGSFLDIIRGHARSAIAVEPSALYRDSLSSRGYAAYPYVRDMLLDYENRVDMVVSFSVLEHIVDPLSFLEEIRRLLSKDGRMIISTPNADDVLLDALPGYQQFFYRRSHLWYFNPVSLAKLLELAGFKRIRIIPFHRFGLGNFLAWLRDKTPQGEIKMDFITPSMDAVWKAELEKTGRCDYMYAEASRD